MPKPLTPEQIRDEILYRQELQEYMIKAGAWICCSNCLWAKRDNGLLSQCGQFHALPPPHVIACGCSSWEHDIPF